MSLIINSFFSAPSGPSLPSDLANLSRWYKADSFVLADNTPIGGVGNEWLDQSGNSADLTNSAADKPVYHTNVFGTKPSIRFTNSRLNMPVFSTTGDFTVILVSKKADNSDAIFLGHSSINNQFRISYGGLNKIELKPNGSIEVISGVFGDAATVIRCQIARRDASLDPDTADFRENTAFRGAGAFDGGVFPMDWDLVGNAFFGGFAYNGDVAELCIYTKYQSNADLDALYNVYFKPRWGLP